MLRMVMKSGERKIKLSDLLLDIANVDIKQDCFISGLMLDSRTVKKGDLFLAWLIIKTITKQF